MKTFEKHETIDITGDSSHISTLCVPARAMKGMGGSARIAARVFDRPAGHAPCDMDNTYHQAVRMFNGASQVAQQGSNMTFSASLTSIIDIKMGFNNHNSLK